MIEISQKTLQGLDEDFLDKTFQFEGKKLSD